jgi:hypothetical protein
MKLRILACRKTKQTQNKRGQISMPRVGFEPTFPMFELTKTYDALDLSFTLKFTEKTCLYLTKFLPFFSDMLNAIKMCMPRKILYRPIKSYLSMLMEAPSRGFSW